MQAFNIPEKVLTEVNRILFNFVWKKKNNNKKAFEKVKRTVLCSDLEEGGLKMIDLKDMQTSFLLQWVSRLTSKEISDSWKMIPTSLFSCFGSNLICFYSNISSKSFKRRMRQRNERKGKAPLTGS